jgi:hypothetical protein
MNYYDWEKTVPAEIKGDSLWKIEAYRLLLTMIPEQRGYIIGEDKAPYPHKMDFTHEKAAINQEELEHLLKIVPLPSL